MSSNPAEPELNLQIQEDLHHSFEVLASSEAVSEDVSQANDFIQEVIQNDLVTFIHLCLCFLENTDEDSKIRYGSLILLRKCLKPSYNRDINFIQHILVQNQNESIMNHLYETLIAFMFGEETELQRPASEAFANALNVCSKYGLFDLFTSNFFTSIKPDTIESALPTFTFFNDLFLTDYFKKIPTDISTNPLLLNLLNLIFFILSTDFITDDADVETISPYIYLALETFQSMLTSLTNFFRYQDNEIFLIKYLLQAPVWLPKSNLEIFNLTYGIILYISKTFYERLRIPFFLDSEGNIYINKYEISGEHMEISMWSIINDLVDNGLSCNDDFLYTVIKFWHKFSKFEFELYFNKNYKYFFTEDEFQPTNYKPYDEKFAPKGEKFTNFDPQDIVKNKFKPEILHSFIDFIFIMDPAQTEFGVPFNFRIPYAVCKSLRYIFMLNPRLITYILGEVVKPKLESTTWTDIHGALLILDAFCYKFKYHFGQSFFRDNMIQIAEFMSNELPILVGSSTIVIKKAIKLYGSNVVPEIVFIKLLENTQKHLEIHHRSLLKTDLSLLLALLKYLPSRNTNEIFSNFADIILLIHTPDLPDVLSVKIENVMTAFADYTTEKKYQQIERFYLNLQERLQQTFEIANSNPVEGIQPFLNYISTIFEPMIHFYTKNPSLSDNHTIFELINNFLQFHDPQLHFLCYISFIELIIYGKNDFSFACEALLTSANEALDSAIPKLVGIAAQLIGSCFKYLDIPENELPKECADKILHHLVEPVDQESLRLNQKDLIKALSEILVGHPDFGVNYLDQFKSILDEMMFYQFDPDNPDECISFQKLYTSIFDSLSNFILYQNKVDPYHTDKQFNNWIKSTVFNKFLKKRVIDNEMYKEKNFLYAFMTFLEYTASKFGTVFNIQLNNRNVVLILDFAYWSKWDRISKRAQRVSEICKHS